MFIIANGHVNIHLPGEASRRISLKDVSNGEYFGELALFDDKPRSASALAPAMPAARARSRDAVAVPRGARARAMMLLRTRRPAARDQRDAVARAKNAVRKSRAS